MNKLTTTAQNNMDDLTNKVYKTKGDIPLESISTYSVLVALEVSEVVSFGGDGGSACKRSLVSFLLPISVPVLSY